jgi:parallel beta-helix repeat protein
MKNTSHLRYALAALVILILAQFHDGATPMAAPTTTERPPTNSPRSIDVTFADGVYVAEPLIASDACDKSVAATNTLRIKAILASPALGSNCTIFFPAGTYYFDGAAEAGEASIQSTHERQTFAGEGINSTQIRQISTTVSATFKISHSGCVVRDMHISSVDYADAFKAEWDAAPHQTAIHLGCPSGTWYTDPQVHNVNINASGNNIVEKGYYRPFREGSRVTGAWLNVYVHTMWMRDVFNAIYVNQGALIAGPAKFIDINAYASTPPENGGGSRTWNIFFKSEGHFMEQVEIIHCTYIGSQFIYMAGSTPSPGINPAYNMVIDHNYINNCWIREGEEASRSGIYLDLPPMADGSNFTRDIRFTNNSCTAKAPKRGAFFYVQGNCRGITFADNDVQSAGDDKCIYIRATQPIAKTKAAIRDIKITNNYFRSFRNPITIGGDRHDPSRTDAFYKGEDDDLFWNERIVIAGNQTYNLEPVDQGFVTTCFINRCRSVNVTGNAFADTDGEGLVLRECKDVAVTGNHFGGFGPDNSKSGIRLIDCEGASVTGNTIRGMRRGIAVSGSSGVALGSNCISMAEIGLDLSDSCNFALHGNQISQSAIPARILSLRDTVVTGNAFSGTGKVLLEGENVNLLMGSNIGTD